MKENLPKYETMLLKEINIHKYFWLVSIMILIIGYVNNLISANSMLDINLDDTYYVISNLESTILLFLLYFLSGFGYWFIQKKLKKELIKYLTFIHTLVLIGGFITYWLIFSYSKLNSPESFPLFDDYELINKTLIIIGLLIIVAQPIYISNLTIGILRRK